MWLHLRRNPGDVRTRGDEKMVEKRSARGRVVRRELGFQRQGLDGRDIQRVVWKRNRSIINGDRQ